MIEEQTMVALIRTTMPDAQVDRHRMVEKALKPARDDGRIHALAIRTELLET